MSAQHHRQTLQQLAGSAEQGPAASRGPPTSATPQKPPRQERLEPGKGVPGWGELGDMLGGGLLRELTEEGGISLQDGREIWPMGTKESEVGIERRGQSWVEHSRAVGGRGGVGRRGRFNLCSGPRGGGWWWWEGAWGGCSRPRRVSASGAASPGLRAEPLRPTAARKDGYGCGYGCGCGCRGGAG